MLDLNEWIRRISILSCDHSIYTLVSIFFSVLLYYIYIKKKKRKWFKMIHLTLNSFSSEKGSEKGRKERKKEVSFNSILISRRWKKDISLEFSFVLRRNFRLDLKLPPRKFRNKRMERTLRFANFIYLWLSYICHKLWNLISTVTGIKFGIYFQSRFWPYMLIERSETILLSERILLKLPVSLKFVYLIFRISILFQYMYERKCARLILKRRIFPGERSLKESYL